MKVIKIIMVVLAYIGVFHVILGTIFVSQTAISFVTSPASSWNQEPDSLVHEWRGFGWILGGMISIPGLALALFGGTIAKPRYFWIILVAIGAIYCITTIIGMIAMSIKTQNAPPELILGVLLFSLPGILCIIGGLAIRWLSKKSERQA